jgi:S1-C subfamily serine protease
MNPGTPEAGLMVAAIEGGSPAERAGLLVGDVLLGVDDEAPHDVESLLGAIAHAGDAVRLGVMRGGKISFVDVNLGASGYAA